MSGPKKADVEAQLNIARNSQRSCANLISNAEDAAIDRILKDVDVILREVDSTGERLRREMDGLSSDMRRIAPESVNSANSEAEDSQRGLDAARAEAARVREAVNNVVRMESSAESVFNRAESEYERASNAIRNAGDHYLHNEMEWARQATGLYDKAAGELASASRSRKDAAQVAAAALRHANEARAAMNNALKQVQSTKNEAAARLRAEEETRKIAEQKKKEAVIGIEKARSAIGRLSDMPHQKFRPGEVDRIVRDLDAGSRLIKENSFDEALKIASRIQGDAARLEKEVAEVVREFERRKAEADSQVSVLEAIISSMDQNLIREWSGIPGVIEAADSAHKTALQKIKGERFEDAGGVAQAAKKSLQEALQLAAEAKSANEKRSKIGDAVMSALEELGFDVSFEQGTRTEPLRISGQTPDELGKGDFDIAIPLDGNVDFEVNTSEGDASCVAAVLELQKRLEARGVKWNTTDWGHAEGAKHSGGIQVKQSVKETVKTKVK